MKIASNVIISNYAFWFQYYLFLKEDFSYINGRKKMIIKVNRNNLTNLNILLRLENLCIVVLQSILFINNKL